MDPNQQNNQNQSMGIPQGQPIQPPPSASPQQSQGLGIPPMPPQDQSINQPIDPSMVGQPTGPNMQMPQNPDLDVTAQSSQQSGGGKKKMIIILGIVIIIAIAGIVLFFISRSSSGNEALPAPTPIPDNSDEIPAQDAMEKGQTPEEQEVIDAEEIDLETDFQTLDEDLKKL